ncbi:MAG: hypothetical protein UT24_C0003G0071 [Candidatus Woesebacteria bacterium GW2011_GWB1_39_12]|uniref:Uncharacterized protein n=1 Tax=Candidatus Woesebacteria bacterium GW2011_GWB1_39_12 TaxID=1618574 RepID=A0A0G0MCA3_9BACT|nr:MAG: hypothetical protein UT24_C0003G0071 [Candidatus Woesebacteria bacterium GW2011_GWB1_39_12]
MIPTRVTYHQVRSGPRTLNHKKIFAILFVVAVVIGAYLTNSYVQSTFYKPLLCSSEPLHSQATERNYIFQSPEQLHIWYGQDYYMNFESSALGQQIYIGTLSSGYSDVYSAQINNGQHDSKDAPFNMAKGDMTSGLWFQNGVLIQVFVCGWKK